MAKYIPQTTLILFNGHLGASNLTEPKAGKFNQNKLRYNAHVFFDPATFKCGVLKGWGEDLTGASKEFDTDFSQDGKETLRNRLFKGQDAIDLVFFAAEQTALKGSSGNNPIAPFPMADAKLFANPKLSAENQFFMRNCERDGFKRERDENGNRLRAAGCTPERCAAGWWFANFHHDAQFDKNGNEVFKFPLKIWDGKRALDARSEGEKIDRLFVNGAIVNIYVRLFPYEFQGKKQVLADMSGIQYVGLGDPMYEGGGSQLDDDDMVEVDNPDADADVVVPDRARGRGAPAQASAEDRDEAPRRRAPAEDTRENSDDQPRRRQRVADISEI